MPNETAWRREGNSRGAGCPMSIRGEAVCIQGEEPATTQRQEVTSTSRVVVNISLTLDGVMQAPARPDEDTRGGFQHGGWATPYFDSVMANAATEAFPRSGALLFGPTRTSTPSGPTEPTTRSRTS